MEKARKVAGTKTRIGGASDRAFALAECARVDSVHGWQHLGGLAMVASVSQTSCEAVPVLRRDDVRFLSELTITLASSCLADHLVFGTLPQETFVRPKAGRNTRHS